MFIRSSQYSLQLQEKETKNTHYILYKISMAVTVIDENCFVQNYH